MITKVISVVHGVKSLNSEGSWMIRCGNAKIERKKRKEGKQMVSEASLMFKLTEKKRAHFSFLLLFLSPAHISSMVRGSTILVENRCNILSMCFPLFHVCISESTLCCPLSNDKETKLVSVTVVCDEVFFKKKSL